MFAINKSVSMFTMDASPFDPALCSDPAHATVLHESETEPSIPLLGKAICGWLVLQSSIIRARLPSEQTIEPTVMGR
jgi:hypothetical protein